MPSQELFYRILHIHEQLMARTRWYPIVAAFALVWTTVTVTKAAL